MWVYLLHLLVSAVSLASHKATERDTAETNTTPTLMRAPAHQNVSISKGLSQTAKKPTILHSYETILLNPFYTTSFFSIWLQPIGFAKEFLLESSWWQGNLWYRRCSWFGNKYRRGQEYYQTANEVGKQAAFRGGG